MINLQIDKELDELLNELLEIDEEQLKNYKEENRKEYVS
jgi:hypothetical protein